MPLLQADSILLNYNNRKILQNVSLQCQTSEIIGILGRNGSGKSSLLKIIFGSIICDNKYLSIDGKVLQKGYYQNQIAYLPQHNYLPQSVRIRHLAKLLVHPGAWDEFRSHNLYRLHAESTAGQLSGGELRLLETLMILYTSAPFILLDEPFTHISPVQVETLKNLIKSRADHKGIIITDHQYHHVLNVAQRLILIQNGSTIPVENYNDLIIYGYLSGS